jgi:hypothetical protein
MTELVVEDDFALEQLPNDKLIMLAQDHLDSAAKAQVMTAGHLRTVKRIREELQRRRGQWPVLAAAKP